MKEFVNDFASWQETHFEVVAFIATELNKDNPTPLVNDRYISQGRGGIYELAEELTNEFEKLNENREWDGEFFDEIDEFINNKA